MRSNDGKKTLLLLAACALVLVCVRAKAPKEQPAPAAAPEATDLATRVQAYVTATDKVRKAAKKEMPKGDKPEEQAKAMEQQRTHLAQDIRALRPNPKNGEFFTPTITAYVKRQLEALFNGPAAATIRDALEEQNDPTIYKTAATPSLQQTIQAPQLPGVLGNDIPSLPEEVEYRFAGRAVVLVDADAGIVLDWIPDALPERPPAVPSSKDTGATGRKTVSFLRMPRKARSVRFAVLGDTGTGDTYQRKVADMLWSYYEQDNRFKFALLLGDNLYAARESASDYRAAFLDPYQKFLDARVVFHATLGNHDLPAQTDFPPFHMGGKERYSFTEHNVKFVCLNSNKPNDPDQLKWLDGELGSADGWRICFFHHPLYSSGVHASEAREIRADLEDALVRNHVNVVFSGHEHFYERVTPQKNIQYFVSGAAAKLRRGDLAGASFTAFGWDREHSVMVVEIDGDTMYFQSLGESGRTIDCGIVYRNAEGEKNGEKDESTRAWLGACNDARAWAFPEGNRQQTARATPP
jgi:hypothetical protein